MNQSRRNFLRLTTLSAAAALAACTDAPDALLDEVSPTNTPLATPFVIQPAPEPTVVPAGQDPIHHLLNRAGFGPNSADLETARALGLEAYLEQQLDPTMIADEDVDALIAALPHYNMPIVELVPLTADNRGDLLADLTLATALRAIFSQRQLYEAMVEFWSDHFYIYAAKSQPMVAFKIVDDREVIRPNALGTFRDILAASMRSPAMLAYLDNVRNRQQAPNENYARELLELHTLGVAGGYTEDDVLAVACVLTGWTIDQNTGETVFIGRIHDDSEKRILGQTFAAGQGEADLEQLIDLLASHPATAKHVVTKLVRRFVDDEPPESLVQAVSDTFLTSGGDTRAMLRTIFLSEEFATAPRKLKRPFTYFVSTLRTLNVTLEPSVYEDGLVRWLRLLGQMPFMWPAPNGYPAHSSAWATSILARWNFALRLLPNEIDGFTIRWDQFDAAYDLLSEQGIRAFAEMVFGRKPTPETVQLYKNFIENNPNSPDTAKQVAAMIMAGPEFQLM